MTERSDSFPDEQNKAEKLTEAQKDFICDNLGSDLHNFWRKLRISESNFYDFNKLESREGNRRAITKWEEANGADANIKAIKMILKSIKRIDIIETLDECSHGKYNEQELTECRNRLESAQREDYKNRQLQVFPWEEEETRNMPVKDLYVDNEMFIPDKQGNEKSEGYINIENVFDIHKDEEKPYRILIEGDAGFGKTTMLLRMVDDWTEKKSYIFDKFKMVFFIYLRNCEPEDSFEDLIRGECENLICGNPEKGLQCVKMFENETLFLLDGYDELSQNSKKNFQRLLRKKEFKTSTVIVSSRRGIFGIERENDGAKGLATPNGTDEDLLKFYSKRISIKGISNENRQRFLRQFFESQTDDVTNRISALADLELYRCPVFLIFLATLRDEEQVHTINTRTSLYKFLVNVIVRRGLVRERMINKLKTVELFDPHHQNYFPKINNMMEGFGKLALDHLTKSQLFFTQKEIEESCSGSALFLQLGFLNKCPTFKNKKYKVFYEPIHKSLLEFFAAFYLFRLATRFFGMGKDQFKKEISNWTEKQEHSVDSSLVFPFLAGLLNEKSSILFEVLLPWSAIYSVYSSFLLNMLKEIRNLDDIFPCLYSFFPQYFNIAKCSFQDHNYIPDYHFFAKLFQRFKNSSSINLLQYDFEDIISTSQSTRSMTAWTLLLDFSNSTTSQINHLYNADFRVDCHDLHCYFPECYSFYWEEVKKLLACIKAVHVHFHFRAHSNFAIKLIEELKNIFLRNPKDVSIYFDKCISDFQNLPILVKIQKIPIKLIFHGWAIKNMSMHVTKEISANACQSVSESISDFDDFFIQEHQFHELFQNNIKWKKIMCQNGDVDISLINESSVCSVEELVLENVSLDISDFMLNHSSGLVRLRCRVSSFTNSILKSCPILHTLQVLRLDLTEDLVHNDFYKDCDFSKLPRLRLQCMTLCFKFLLSSGLLHPLKVFMTFVGESDMDILEMSYQKRENGFVLLYLDSLLKIGQNKTRNQLKELRLPYHVLESTDFKKVLSRTKELMDMKQLNKLVLFQSFPSTINSLVQTMRIDLLTRPVMASVFSLAQDFNFSRGTIGINSRDKTMLVDDVHWEDRDRFPKAEDFETIVLTLKNNDFNVFQKILKFIYFQICNLIDWVSLY